jgi:hypothetical protein
MREYQTKKQKFSGIEQHYLEFVSAFGSEQESFDVHAVRDRQGIFSFALTVWLMLLQRFNPRHSLSGAIEELVNGGAEGTLSKIERSKKIKLRKISLNTGGFSQARSRIGKAVISKLVEFVTNKIIAVYGDGMIDGQKIYLLDGTGMTVSNSADVIAKYPRQRTRTVQQQYPYLRVVFAHNLGNGIAMYPSHGTLKQSEQELSLSVLKCLPKDSLVIADRNFGVYSVTYSAVQAGVQTLTRLNDSQSQMLSKSNGDTDERVVWAAPSSGKSDLYKAYVGTQVEGRLIRRSVARKGQRALLLHFFTTSKLPADQLVTMYLYRERIENDIRDIKHTLCLQLGTTKSADMIEKELLLGILAYNLIRIAIADAAKIAGLEPRQVSFSRAIAVIRIMHYKLHNATSQDEIDAALNWFPIAIRQIQIYKRPKKRPAQPRKIMALRSKRYPSMRKSRAEEVATLNPHII